MKPTLNWEMSGFEQKSEIPARQWVVAVLPQALPLGLRACSCRTPR